MKFRRDQIIACLHKVPAIRFDRQEDGGLTSFAGLIIFQVLFQRLRLKQRLKACFSHVRPAASYPAHLIVLWLITHLVLGYRRLRERDYYADDPLVRRVLGLRRLPDVATVSRSLAVMDEAAVEDYRRLAREMVLERLETERLSRLTLDFDGSVCSTGRRAEGAAIGFNKKKKGLRSYYPLFCTVAQTAQILDLHHRPGNVHDSNGARPFIAQCIDEVRRRRPRAALEARLDSAFFNEEQLTALDRENVQFTASTPFEQFAQLKAIIQNRRHWRRIDETWSYFECDWKPKSWRVGFRIIVLRQRKALPVKGPLQLDLFEPRSRYYDYSVIITNKTVGAAAVMNFHHGRGSQEGVFAEAKSHCALEYVPVRRLCGNQVYCLSAVMAHNLTRELQIESCEREYGTTPKRRNLWGFQTLGSLRGCLIRRAGRLIRPQGRLTLVMNANERVQEDIEQYLNAA